jgi:hypothetical protein
MGQANPYQLGGHRDYVWNGDPAKSIAAEKAAAPERKGFRSEVARAERLAAYFAARDRGQDKPTAAETAGIGAATSRDYEREYSDYLKRKQAAS